MNSQKDQEEWQKGPTPRFQDTVEKRQEQNNPSVMGGSGILHSTFNVATRNGLARTTIYIHTYVYGVSQCFRKGTHHGHIWCTFMVLATLMRNADDITHQNKREMATPPHSSPMMKKSE
jgi:hypothetical protein